MQKADSSQEFYLKLHYPVEVLSEVKDGLVEVRAKTTFLHTRPIQMESVKFESASLKSVG